MLETAAQQNPSNGAWGGGSLSDEEFERAALSFRPSWEVGIDVVASSDSLAPPVAAKTAESFTKDTPAKDVLAAAAAPEVRTSLAPPAAAIRPVPAPRPAVRSEPPRVAPRDIKASLPDQLPVKRTSPGVYLGAGLGALAVVGALVFAFGGSSSTPSTPRAEPSVSAPAAAEPAPAAPAPEPTPAAAAPEPAPAPPPAPVVAAPEPPPAPAPAPPPAPVVAAPPPAPVPAPVARVAPAPAAPRPVVREPVRPAIARPSAPRAARPAGASRGSSPRGAGFVTDNPY